MMSQWQSQTRKMNRHYQSSKQKQILRPQLLYPNTETKIWGIKRANGSIALFPYQARPDGLDITIVNSPDLEAYINATLETSSLVGYGKVLQLAYWKWDKVFDEVYYQITKEETGPTWSRSVLWTISFWCKKLIFEGEILPETLELQKFYYETDNEKLYKQDYTYCELEQLADGEVGFTSTGGSWTDATKQTLTINIRDEVGAVIVPRVKMSFVAQFESSITTTDTDEKSITDFGFPESLTAKAVKVNSAPTLLERSSQFETQKGEKFLFANDEGTTATLPILLNNRTRGTGTDDWNTTSNDDLYNTEKTDKFFNLFYKDTPGGAKVSLAATTLWNVPNHSMLYFGGKSRSTSPALPNGWYGVPFMECSPCRQDPEQLLWGTILETPDKAPVFYPMLDFEGYRIEEGFQFTRKAQ